jgi:hypothetical protein
MNSSLDIIKKDSQFKKDSQYKGRTYESIYYDNIKTVLKLEYITEKKLNEVLQCISNINVLYFIGIYYYVEIDTLMLSLKNNYKITKQQLFIIYDLCKKNGYAINDQVNFDFNQISRRMKIEKIMKRIK